MKIQAVNMNNSYCITYKASNKYAAYSVRCLIASATLFMGANAIDSFQYDVTKRQNKTVFAINSVASLLGVAGTVIGVVALKKEDT